MRFILILFFGAIITSANAQWYRIRLKKRPRPEPIESITIQPINLPKLKIAHPALRPIDQPRTAYSLETAEAVVMKAAQHNMRFRIYNLASYNFTELAHLFAQESRYSEAVWYLLQSNNISREENDDKHTIENLIDLATMKADMGEIPLAQQDLTEAHDLAIARGLTPYLETIDLASQYITQNKLPKQRPALIYAEGANDSHKTNNK